VRVSHFLATGIALVGVIGAAGAKWPYAGLSKPPVPGNVLAMYCRGFPPLDSGRGKFQLYVSLPFQYKIPKVGNYWDPASRAMVSATNAKYGSNTIDTGSCFSFDTVEEASADRADFLNGPRVPPTPIIDGAISIADMLSQ